MPAEISLASRDYKVLISTTSRLVGEYRGGKVGLAPAFPGLDSVDLQREQGPTSRSGVMVLFAWELLKTPEEQLLDLSAEQVGQCVCDVLSVLYGKRFDSHGAVEASGIFQVADLTSYSRPSRSRLPFNSHSVRASFPVPLELGKVASVEKWLVPAVGDDRTRRIQTACGFYTRALRNAEDDAEVAYLHLITAGEVLASLDGHGREELLDESARGDFEQARECLGELYAHGMLGRMGTVKRGFVKSLLGLLDEDFYEAGIADPENGTYFKAEGMEGLGDKRFDMDMAKCLGSAYDVRSRYVHSGVPFGSWVSTIGRLNGGDRVGRRPFTLDKGLGKVLETSPTLCGLERVLRYALLKRTGVPKRPTG